jgi:BspA type Leucine rich repeat region (6 copies)
MTTDRLRIFLLATLCVALPGVAQAQLHYTTNSGVITITGFTGGGPVVIPATTNGLSVTSIAEDAFQDDTITSVTLPGTMTNIGYQAFGYCNSLTSVTLDGALGANIGQYAFEPCSSLTNVVISNGVTKIPEEMFGECTSLVTITIPASVTNIAEAAFDNCSSLTSIYCLGNEPVLGADAFTGVNATTARVYYLAGATGWGPTYGPLTTVELISVPRITNPGIQGNEFGFIINGSSNQVIVVQATTNLTNGTWTTLQSNVLAGTTANFTDTQWTNFPRRYYRLSTP